MTVFESVKEAIANNLDNVDIEKVTLESEIGKGTKFNIFLPKKQ